MARKVLVEENDARKIYATACDDGSLIIQFCYMDGNGHVLHANSENFRAHTVMALRAELDRAAQLRDEAVRELADESPKTLRTEDSVGSAGETCPACDGTGYRPISPTILAECKSCNGSGQV